MGFIARLNNPLRTTVQGVSQGKSAKKVVVGQKDTFIRRIQVVEGKTDVKLLAQHEHSRRNIQGSAVGSVWPDLFGVVNNAVEGVELIRESEFLPVEIGLTDTRFHTEF